MIEMIRPIMIKVIPKINTSILRLSIINTEVTIPSAGNTGNRPMLPGTRNPVIFGLRYRRYISDAFTSMNMRNMVKFVKFAIVFNSPRNINSIEVRITIKIAGHGVYSLFDTR